MTTFQKKVFDDILLSPFITSMSQENIILIEKFKDIKPMAIQFNLYQWSASPLSVQDTSKPAYGCRLSGIL